MSTRCLFWALKSKVGNPYQKLILISLADIANEKMQCWPSHQYLADRAECSRSTVIRHIDALEKHGFIQCLRRVDDDGLKSSNLYTVRCVTETHPDVSDRHKGSVTETHNTLIDTPTIINGEAWREWLAFRAKKKKVTEDARKKQWKLLETYSHEDQQKIIDHSIQNDYQGLFPLKDKNNENTKNTINGFKDSRRLSGAERTRIARDQLRQRELAQQSSDLGSLEPG